MSYCNKTQFYHKSQQVITDVAAMRVVRASLRTNIQFFPDTVELVHQLSSQLDNDAKTGSPFIDHDIKNHCVCNMN